MEKMASWVTTATALSGLLLFVGSGCMKDLDSLSANYGKGGAGGHAGKTGSSGSHTGGSATGGSPEAGEGGEGGEGESEGRGGTGGRGSGGSGGRGAIGGGTCEDNGLTSCTGVKGCVDLSVGTPIDNGVDNCGACGTNCSLDNAASATCAAGACVLSCNAGLGDCNVATANDGCEADITTVANCGSCNNACSLNGVSSTECIGSACVPACAPLYADCNSSMQPKPNDGCEVFLDALEKCTTSCTDAAVACEATPVCNAGSCVAPNGIAVLTTPFHAANDKTRFSDIFPGGPLDLTGFTVKMRVYAPGATGGTATFFVSDASSMFGSEVSVDLIALSQKWTDVTIPVAGVNTKTVKQANILLTAADPIANPTVVYVDSVRVSNQLVNETFDSNFGGFARSGLVFADKDAAVTWTAAMP